jgi:predicted heme/steroid binding protein
MKYILLQTAFTWMDGVDRIGHRPLSSLERRGVVHAYVNLGQLMGIAEIEHDYDSMYTWYVDFNQRNAAHHPVKQDTFERILGNSLTDVSEPLRGVVRTSVRAAMGEEYRRAVGEPAATDAELVAVRALMAALGNASEWLPTRPWVRSVMDVPGRRLPPPSQLGAGARAATMPASGDPSLAGGPSGLPPVRGAGEVPPAPDRIHSSSEIARHASAHDLWVVIDGEVYDLTALVEAHPGGSAILLDYAGKDASEAFRQARHPGTVEILRANYRIGRVADSG